MPKSAELLEGFQRRVFRQGEGGGLWGVISSWIVPRMVGGEIIRGQHHQPSGSNWFGVSMLMGSTQLTFPTWWGFQYEQNSSKDMAQNAVYSP